MNYTWNWPVTIGAYEKLVETVGVDSTLAVFYKQVKKVNGEKGLGKSYDFNILEQRVNDTGH